MSKSGAAAAADAECADSDRLCDYKDCRKPLYKLLFCSKCKCTEGKIVYCKHKGNIHVDVRARGRAKRSAPRKAAACAPGGTEGQ